MSAPAKGMTVRQVINRLMDFPMDAVVWIGVCDDDFNVPGGVFVQVEDVHPEAICDPNDEPQLTAWANLKELENTR